MGSSVDRARCGCVCEPHLLVKKMGVGPIGSKPGELLVLPMKLGNKQLELLDRAASPHAGTNRVALGAKSVVGQLQVEAAVEVERGAIFIEHGPNVLAIAEDEIDLLRPRKGRMRDRPHGDALRPLLLLPLDADRRTR